MAIGCLFVLLKDNSELNVSLIKYLYEIKYLEKLSVLVCYYKKYFTLFMITFLFSYDVNAQDAKANIVLIMADDMGFGDLSSYGHPVIKTPNLDGLANEGIRLTSFYAAAATCTQSRAGLMTGRHAVRSGMHTVLFPNSETGMPESENTIAEVLKNQGYQTAMVGKWHLGDRKPFLPTDNGFDEYFGLLYSNDMISPWVIREPELPPLMFYRDDQPAGIVENQSTLTTRYTEETISQLERLDKNKPFFLYVAHAMPHLPVSVPESFKGSSRAGLYGDVIETIDWSVAQILKALKDNDLDDNTIVIFTSDNGPWLNLKIPMLTGGVERSHAGSKGLLRGSKASTYEGGLRVPAIIRWPHKIKAHQSSAEPVSGLDLYATIVSIAGAKIPQDRVIDGADLTNFLTGITDKSPNQSFFYYKGQTLEAVREGRWKLRISRALDTNELIPEGKAAPVELYDLETDPSEQFNRANEEQNIVAHLTKRLQDFAEETRAFLAE
jgi:arylsulfatase A